MTIRGTIADIRPCDVCAILDGDERQKLVVLCELCGAWMCADCKENPIRRARALVVRDAQLVRDATKEWAQKWLR